MSVTTWQCGYSRLGGQEATAGWQAFELGGGGIPTDALTEFSTMQSQNVSSGTPTDTKGNPLRLYEIVGNGQFLYVTWIQYGLEDDMGRRNNMFAQAVVFSLSDPQVVKEPETFLTLEEESFRTSYEEAKNKISSPVFGEKMDIETSLKKTGLNRDSWRKLIYAVYSAREQKRPLYIRTERADHIWKDVLYCIYYALPFGLRKSLSATNALVNPGNHRDLVFSDDFRGGNLFFDLTTGENNALTEREEKKYRRWGFTDYAVESFPEGVLAYFDALEKISMSLGDSSGAKSRFLRIAHRIVCSDQEPVLSPDDLKYRLYEALQTGITQNETMDRYITGLLYKINEQDIEVLDATDELLREYLSSTQSSSLMTEGKKYTVHVIMRQSTEEGCKRLLNLAQDRQFQEYAYELAKEDRGCQILALYYSTLVANAGEAWEDLYRIAEEVSRFPAMSSVYDEMSAKAFELYIKELKSGGNPEGALNNYCTFMESTIPGISTTGMANSAKDVYWEDKHVADFRLENENEYSVFITQGNLMAVAYAALLNGMAALRLSDYQKFGLEIEHFYICADKLGENVSWGERRIIADDFLHDFIRENPGKSNESIETFVRLITITGWADVMMEFDNICQYISNGDWVGFKEIYCRRVASVPEECMPFETMNMYNWLLCKEVAFQGQGSNMTLDMFLLMGKNMYANPFTILDYEDEWPAGQIMDDDPEQVVYESELLKDPVYRNMAENYIQGDYYAANVVKEWLAIRKKMDKQEKKKNTSRKRSRERKEKKPGEWRDPFEFDGFNTPEVSPYSNRREPIGTGESEEKSLRGLFRRKKGRE